MRLPPQYKVYTTTLVEFPIQLPVVARHLNEARMIVTALTPWTLINVERHPIYTYHEHLLAEINAAPIGISTRLLEGRLLSVERDIMALEAAAWVFNDWTETRAYLRRYGLPMRWGLLDERLADALLPLFSRS